MWAKYPKKNWKMILNRKYPKKRCRRRSRNDDAIEENSGICNNNNLNNWLLLTSSYSPTGSSTFVAIWFSAFFFFKTFNWFEPNHRSPTNGCPNFFKFNISAITIRLTPLFSSKHISFGSRKTGIMFKFWKRNFRQLELLQDERKHVYLHTSPST